MWQWVVSAASSNHSLWYSTAALIMLQLQFGSNNNMSLIRKCHQRCCSALVRKLRSVEHAFDCSVKFQLQMRRLLFGHLIRDKILFANAATFHLTRWVILNRGLISLSLRRKCPIIIVLNSDCNKNADLELHLEYCRERRLTFVKCLINCGCWVIRIRTISIRLPSTVCCFDANLCSTVYKFTHPVWVVANNLQILNK